MVWDEFLEISWPVANLFGAVLPANLPSMIRKIHPYPLLSALRGQISIKYTLASQEIPY